MRGLSPLTRTIASQEMVVATLASLPSKSYSGPARHLISLSRHHVPMALSAESVDVATTTSDARSEATAASTTHWTKGSPAMGSRALPGIRCDDILEVTTTGMFWSRRLALADPEINAKVLSRSNATALQRWPEVASGPTIAERSESDERGHTLKSPQLLECTLRDGSYAVDFQFTAEDTRIISGSLDALNFPYIEIGHGVGIGASRAGMPAAATDLAYARAAQLSVTRAKWGMFGIHGIVTIGEVRALRDEGMSFVRIGVDPGEISGALPLVDSARSLGLEVFVNLMKSYTQPPKAVGDALGALERAGAYGVYLVDSAGGMLPSEILAYIEVMLDKRNQALLGFHGHDNLGLAVAHSVTAASKGFDLIDCTMQGIGRSSGNAGTERLVALLRRLGDERFDVAGVCQSGEELIRPRLPRAGYSGLDTFAGFTLFHSSYMPRLLAVAKRLRVDPYVLMQEHCAVDQLDASTEDLEALSLHLLSRGHTYEGALPGDLYAAGDQ